MIRQALAVGLGLSALLFAGGAFAQDGEMAAETGGDAAQPIKPVRLGALIGYGLGEGDINAYQLGIGFRGGYKFDFNLYVGGTFVYHLGDSQEQTSAFGKVETNVGIYYYGVELGYGLAAGPVEVMPFVGLGAAAAHAEVCINDTCASGDSSETKLYVAPGAQVLYPIGGLFVGADARYILVTDSEDTNSVAFYGTVGGHF